MNRHFAGFALCLLAAAVPAEEFPAVLDWSQRASLGTPVSGVVGSIAVSPGEHVEAGQLLLQFDQRPFESALRDARAQLHKQRLLRDEARRELERTRELYERRVIADHDLQLGEIAFAVAEADYSSAAAAFDSASLQSEYSRLQAPFAGRVLAVQATPGMTVINTEQATPLITLAQDRPMHALVQVSATAVDGFSAGQAATVSVAGKHFEGRLDYLAAEADGSGVYLLRFSFDPGKAALRAGLPAEVETQGPAAASR